MNDSACIIIFGITGDLAKRKLIPALYNLLVKKRIADIAIVGAAYDAVEPASILQAAQEHIKGPIDQEIWQQLHDFLYYQQLNFKHADEYAQFASLINTVEKKHKLSGNRLVYLAAAANFFCDITEYIGASGIAKRAQKNKPWQRIVYEKPFGWDLQSAHDINMCIKKWFEEHQIYRVDHYLTKELVSNISLLRFTNCVFEPLWNNRYLDHVQIILSESSGIGNRGAYYDHFGALRDVVQNHMLELLALIAMEAPEKLSGECVQIERAKVLAKTKVIDGILGQYDGYTKEPHVRPDSGTETFAMLYLTVNNPRWAGVPFYLKTGKCLDKYEVIIHLKFKQVDCLLTKNCPSNANWLTIRVAPDASFILTLNAKKPGRTDELMTVPMEFCHSCLYGAITPDAYEVLVEEVVAGEQATSVRFDEIESAWKVIDAIYKKELPLYSYACGSSGPKEVEQFCKKHGMRWRS